MVPMPVIRQGSMNVASPAVDTWGQWVNMIHLRNGHENCPRYKPLMGCSHPGFEARKAGVLGGVQEPETQPFNCEGHAYRVCYHELACRSDGPGSSGPWMKDQVHLLN